MVKSQTEFKTIEVRVAGQLERMYSILFETKGELPLAQLRSKLLEIELSL